MPVPKAPLQEPEITEMVDIEVSRIDGVATAANGFPILLMKSLDVEKDVNPQGGVDEKPDIDQAEQVLVLLARLIEAEAREMAVGNWDESSDIGLLSEAVSLMRLFRAMEEHGDEDDGEPIYKGSVQVTEDDLRTFLAKRKVSTSERKRLAGEGKALSDGSYPIENTEDLKNAAILARSGHGNVADAKKLIAKRAKELGVPNPLASDTAKDTAEPEATEETEATEVAEKETETSEAEKPQEDAPEEVSEVVKSAIADAVKPLEEANRELRDELAVLKATPIPGGPALTVPPSMRGNRAESETLAEISRLEKAIDQTRGDPELSKYYKDKLSEVRKGLKPAPNLS